MSIDLPDEVRERAAKAGWRAYWENERGPEEDLWGRRYWLAAADAVAEVLAEHAHVERNEMKAEMATKAEAARKWERMAESSRAERDALRRKLRKANKHRKRLEARADKLADELDLVSRGWEARVAARDKRHEEHSAVTEERDQLRLKVAEQANQCDAMSQMLRRMARKRTADRGMARLSLSYWTSARDLAVEQRDKLRDEMVSALGLPPMSTPWEWGYAHKVVIDRIKKLQSQSS